MSNAMPALRDALIGKVTTTAPPVGSMRKETRRARLLRRHSTRATPEGRASISGCKSSMQAMRSDSPDSSMGIAEECQAAQRSIDSSRRASHFGLVSPEDLAQEQFQTVGAGA